MTSEALWQHETPKAHWQEHLLPAGIGARLFLLTALVLLPMLLLLGWVYYQRYQTRRMQALQTELEVAQGTATLFDAYVEDVRREEYLVGQAILTFETYTTENASRILSIASDQYAAVTSMNWVSPQGRVLASSEPGGVNVDLSDRPYFQEILGGEAWVISDLLQQGRIDDQSIFVIATGVGNDAGELQGVVVATLNPEQLNELALTTKRPAGGAYTIFDRQGTLVYRNPEIPLTWEERTHWKETDDVLRETMQTGQVATGITDLGIIGGEWVSARVPIRGIGWIAGAGRPVEVAYARFRRGLVQDTLLALIGTALALALAALIGRTIAYPLRRLQGDVRTFSDGDLSHRAEVAGPREVALVAVGFNEAAEELQDLRDTLEARVRQRTTELEASNKELASFNYTVAHDLRSPLRALDGYSKYLLDRYSTGLDARGQDYLARIRAAAQRMGRLIDDLLNLGRVTRMPMRIETVDISALSIDIFGELRRRDQERRVTVEIEPGLQTQGDRELLRMALAHLLENAWKFTSMRDEAFITVGAATRDGELFFYVRDNGVGFDMKYADKLFQAFHRLHAEDEFPGTGIGLALVQRIIQRHGGRVWAEAAVGEGATFWFCIGE